MIPGPRRRRAEAEMTFDLLTKQPDRGQSCAYPHLWFPGCFTRPPGTSTRDHPHEPTTSKPVVPGDALHIECSATARAKKRRGPGPLEEPLRTRPKAGPDWWRGLTPRWPRSLRLGSASGWNVHSAPARGNVSHDVEVALWGKCRCRAGRRGVVRCKHTV